MRDGLKSARSDARKAAESALPKVKSTLHWTAANAAYGGAYAAADQTLASHLDGPQLLDHVARVSHIHHVRLGP